MTLTNEHPAKTDVIGPYSPWPRTPSKRTRRVATLTGIAATGAIFVHCVVPTIG